MIVLSRSWVLFGSNPERAAGFRSEVIVRVSLRNGVSVSPTKTQPARPADNWTTWCPASRTDSFKFGLHELSTSLARQTLVSPLSIIVFSICTFNNMFVSMKNEIWTSKIHSRYVFGQTEYDVKSTNSKNVRFVTVWRYTAHQCLF